MADQMSDEELMMMLQNSIKDPNMQDPSQTDINQLVSANGVAPAQSKSAIDQYMQMLQSPEYQAKIKEYNDRAKQAIEQQRKGLGENEKSLNVVSDTAKLSPLLSLVDQWTGTNLNQGLTPDKVMALKSALQSQRAGLSDKELALLKDQLSGAGSPLQQLKTLGTMEYQQRYNPGAQMQQLAEFRAAQGARDKILQRLSNNKDLGARLNAYQTLDNAMTNMAAGKIRTPQQLQDFQDAIIAGLGMSRGQSGVNERAERQFNTMDLKGSRLMQFLTSKPQDVMNNKELIGHLQDLARQEQVNVRSQYQRRLNALGSGYGRLMDKYPDIKNDIQDALQSYAGQFESPAVPELSKLKKGQQVHVGPKPKAYAPVPGQSAQSGPAVDADLDKMSADELQQWLNSHGK